MLDNFDFVYTTLFTAIIGLIAYFLKKTTTENKADKFLKYNDLYKKSISSKEKDKFIEKKADVILGELLSGFASPMKQKIYIYLYNHIDIENNIKIIIRFTIIKNYKLKSTITPLVSGTFLLLLTLILIALILFLFLDNSSALNEYENIVKSIVLLFFGAFAYISVLAYVYLFISYLIFKFSLQKKYKDIIKKAYFK